MKNLLLTLASFSLLISSYSYSQEIDPSIISQLSTEQINQAKKAYAGLNSTDSKVTEMPVLIESIQKKDVKDSNNIDNQKFGYGFFSTIPTSTSAVGDLPLPNDYKISIRDQFTVILSGSKEAIFDLNVKLDGTILFPEIGSISVIGETFGQVKEKLSNLIDQTYIGVKIDLSIKNLSAKKITIVGAVKTPGTYLVNPFSTISSALAYSGGISQIGTLRNIKLIRNNGNTFNFDLYKLLINGDRSADINIEAGDVILIEAAEQFITLTGEVRRPAIYEIAKNETLEDLVKFGLGFSPFANKTNIDVRILNIEASSIQKISISNLGSDLNNVISVNINKYRNKNMANIQVTGAIKEPGSYALNQNETLENLINNLEFIDVYPWLAVLEQFDDNNLLKTSILFSLLDPNTYRSIKLLPNSKIFFADINSRTFDIEPMTMQSIREYDLRVNHKQGTFNLPVYGQYSVKSFVDLLGLDMSDVLFEATYISPLEDLIIKDDYRKMKFSAQKYNTVSFRSPINDLITVTIEGAVDYPGKYRLNSESTLDDLYKLVGNFKNEAFLDGIIFTRESIRNTQLKSLKKSREQLDLAILTSLQEGDNIGDVNLIRGLSESIEPQNLGRLAGNYAPQSTAANKTILFEGDKVFIPKNPNVISVLGEVLNPITLEYSEDYNVRSAVLNAGGYQEYADKSRVYVIRANGIVERASRNIFTKNIKLAPGDTIVVPRMIIDQNNLTKTLVPITSIISNLAFSSAAINNLQN
jgi:polysaccharide biosynthesis/export protein